MSVYLLCKGEFSCVGDSQEDPSQGFFFSLAVFSPAGALVIRLWFPPDFFLETFYSYAFIIFVRVGVLSKTRHACKSSVF